MHVPAVAGQGIIRIFSIACIVLQKLTTRGVLPGMYCVYPWEGRSLADNVYNNLYIGIYYSDISLIKGQLVAVLRMNFPA